MARRGSVRVSITGDADGLGRATRDAEGKLDRLNRAGGRVSRGLGTLGSVAKTGVAAGFIAAGAGAKIAYDEFREAEKVSAQTEATLKSTGHAAGLTKRDIEDLAGSISRKTAIDDEQIQSGENLLLTFTNVRNEVGKGNDIFSQATSIMTDMSVALGQDTKSSAIQLGKALNDPVKGVTALQRVGVSFTEQQRDQIQAMVDSGKTMDAQKLILRELNKEFGGSARAAATPMDHLRTTLGNVAEVVGSKLVPLLDEGAKFVNKFVQQIQGGTGAGGKFADAVKVYAQVVKTEWAAIADAVRVAVSAVGDWLRRNHDDIVQLGRAFQNIGKAIVFVFEKAILPVVKRVLPAVLGALRGFVQLASGIVEVFTGLFTGDFRKMWEGLKDIFGGGIKLILNQVRLVTAPMREIAHRIGQALTATLGKAWDTVMGGARAMGKVVRGVFDALRAAVRFVVGKILDAIDLFLGGLEAMARAASHLPFVGGKFKGVADAIANTRDKLQGLKGELDGTPGKAGKLNLLLSKVRALKTAFDGVASSAGNAFGAIAHPGGGPQGDPKTIAEKFMARFAPATLGSPTSGTYRYANQVASMFGLHVTSGWRSPQHNASVGGVPGSMHTHGTASNPGAIDLVGPTANMYQAAAWARAHLPVKEVLVHDAGSGLHLHLGFFEKGGKVDHPMFMVGEEAPQHPEFVIATNPAYRRENVGHLIDAAQALGVPGFKTGGQYTGKGDQRRYVPTIREALRFPLDRLEADLSDAEMHLESAKGRTGRKGQQAQIRAMQEVTYARGVLASARPFAARIRKHEDYAEIHRQQMDLADQQGKQKKYDLAKRKYISSLRHQRSLLTMARSKARKGSPYWRFLQQQILSLDLAIAQAKGAQSQAELDAAQPGFDTEPPTTDVGTPAPDAGETVEPAGPTQDEVAQRERADLRAYIQARAGALNAAFGYTASQSGDLGFTVIVNQNNLVPGSPDVLRQVGQAAAAGFSLQGAVTSSRETVA